MPKGNTGTARNVGFSSERLAPCIYRILAARAYFHGSSPRMWGTHRLQQHADAVLRFIPTHVGNTLRCSGRSAPSPVHTHVGNTAARSPRPHRRRFIPTHVGNTTVSTRPFSPRSVHPHACGEHPKAQTVGFRYYGSSPRMWGTQVDYLLHQRADRFIPTHVGNTAACGS